MGSGTWDYVMCNPKIVIVTAYVVLCSLIGFVFEKFLKIIRFLYYLVGLVVSNN